MSESADLSEQQKCLTAYIAAFYILHSNPVGVTYVFYLFEVDEITYYSGTEINGINKIPPLKIIDKLLSSISSSFTFCA